MSRVRGEHATYLVLKPKKLFIFAHPLFIIQTRFINKFDKPIIAAMSVDCTETEVARQDELSSELREILSSIVHRCTNDVLKKTLPFLQETIITIRQSRAQAKVCSDCSCLLILSIQS